MATALVTGASRGIGRAITQRLAADGWDVVAGVRRPADGDALVAEAVAAGAAGSVRPIHLDVTDADDIAALGKIEQLDAVVNNAGVAVFGPLEGLATDDLRRQLEVNVVGQVAVTQAVLPQLRAARGRVVFVSSLSGRVATPLTGAYNASKFAVEAAADAIRMELRPWGVRVSLVEPAQVDTDIWRTADEEIDAAEQAMSPEQRALHADHFTGFRRTIPFSRKLAVLADATPTAVRDAVLRRATGVPTKAKGGAR